MIRAAKGVILTAEDMAPIERFREEPEMTAIPGFLVTAVAHAPGGAAPCSCSPAYGVVEARMRRYMEVSRTVDGLAGYLTEAEALLPAEAAKISGPAG